MNYEEIVKDCMKKDYAMQICRWNYDDDYSVYNLPTYEECVEKGYSITKEEKKDNYVVYLLNDEVVFYLNMKPIEDNKIYIGVGLKPDYCSKGIGNYFLKDSVDEIKKRYSNSILFLEVRSWNVRAIKAYEKIGFEVINDNAIKEDREGNKVQFTEMIMN